MLSFSFFKIDSKAKQAMKSSPKVHRNYEKKKKVEIELLGYYQN